MPWYRPVKQIFLPRTTRQTPRHQVNYCILSIMVKSKKIELWNVYKNIFADQASKFQASLLKMFLQAFKNLKNILFCPSPGYISWEIVTIIAICVTGVVLITAVLVFKRDSVSRNLASMLADLARVGLVSARNHPSESDDLQQRQQFEVIKIKKYSLNLSSFLSGKLTHSKATFLIFVYYFADGPNGKWHDTRSKPNPFNQWRSKNSISLSLQRTRRARIPKTGTGGTS